MKTLYLVRHGTVHNPDRISYRRLPGFHLSERGRREAEVAADKLLEVPAEVIIHSPMERAEETAAIINQTKQIPMLLEDKINEWETYEDFATVRSRMLEFFEDWVRSPERVGILVAHRDPIRALLHGLEGTEFVWADDRDLPFPLPPSGVWRVDNEGGRIERKLIWQP